MKQTILILFLVFGGINQVLACDVCGCASSAFTLGMPSNSKFHLVGLRTTLRWFDSYPSPDGDGYRDISTQFFSSTDFFGRYRISKRFQVQAFLPFVYNSKTDSVTTRISGLGDAVVLGNFVFIDNLDSLSRKFQHIGMIGLGVKVPSGQFFKLGLDEVNMMPGTGSTDLTANFNYAVQFRKFGLQNESGFTYKTENKYKYRFGNALSISQVLYYRWKVNENTIFIPQLGVNYSHNWRDQKNGGYASDSFNGGTIYNALANLFVYYKNVRFNGQFYIPIQQNLNQSLVNQKTMIRLGFNYFIKSKK